MLQQVSLSLKRNWELALLLAVAAILKVPELGTPFFWDEIAYTKGAVWLTENGLWKAIPGQHPETLFLGHEPGFHFLLALLFRAFGFSIPLARAAMLLESMMQLIFTAKIARYLGGRWAGFLAASALLALPFFFSHSIQVLADVSVASLGAAVCWAAVAGGPLQFALVGALLAFQKETALAIVLPAMLFRLWRAARERRALIGEVPTGVPLLCIGVFFLAEKVVTGKFSNFPFLETFSPSPLATIERAYVYGRQFFWDFQKMWIITAAAVAGTIVVLIRGEPLRRGYVGLLWAVCAANLAGIALFTAVNTRYVFPSYPLLFALALGGIVHGLGRLAPVLALALPAWALAGLPSFHRESPMPGRFFEETMQYRDLVRLHREVALFLRAEHPRDRVYAVWPVDEELSLPYLGYVPVPIPVVSRPRDGADFDLVITTNSSAPHMLRLQREAVEAGGMKLKKRFEVEGNVAELWEKKQRGP